jgi:DNA-directed RNA polymerase specialized sigma24 family protein
MADHRAAHESLLRRYVAPLRRLAWSYVRDPAGRDDLFQEIATALSTALPRFRGDSSERTWSIASPSHPWLRPRRPG